MVATQGRCPEYSPHSGVRVSSVTAWTGLEGPASCLSARLRFMGPGRVTQVVQPSEPGLHGTAEWAAGMSGVSPDWLEQC